MVKATQLTAKIQPQILPYYLGYRFEFIAFKIGFEAL